MKRLIALSLLCCSLTACSVNWVTVLTWAKEGLIPVCAAGQQTLSPAACTNTLDGLDALIATVQRDPEHAKEAVHKWIADDEKLYPEVTDWFSWIRV